jgi:hypothetical protein
MLYDKWDEIIHVEESAEAALQWSLSELDRFPPLSNSAETAAPATPTAPASGTLLKYKPWVMILLVFVIGMISGVLVAALIPRKQAYVPAPASECISQ